MKELKLKPGVKINGKHFNLEIRVILDVARKTAPELTDQCVWVTSANDSKHMENSKHYSNEAFDIRTRNVMEGTAAIQKWAADIRKELGPQYDVVVEKDHLHIELDPKV